MINDEPESELGKLLLVLVQEVAQHSPRAFHDVHVKRALEQADAAASRPADAVAAQEKKP